MSQIKNAPAFTSGEAVSIAEKFYGLKAKARELPSERDQNFLLQDKKGQKFVLKVANSNEKRETLEFQNKVMYHLRKKGNRKLCSSPLPSLCGKNIIATQDSEGISHFVRLLEYIEGKTLGESSPHSPELLYDLGVFIAQLVQTFSTFSQNQPDKPDKPEYQPDLIWNMKNGPRIIQEYKSCIDKTEKQRLVERFIHRIQTQTFPCLPELSQNLIHNDANDYNIIVSPPDKNPSSFGRRAIAGILDFGDLTYSYVLSELAVAVAYAMLNKERPLLAASHIVCGYNSILPLSDEELSVLFDLICLRLCMSVCICAYQRKLNPYNPYLTISEKPAWELLQKLEEVPSRLACFTFRAACGFQPVPDSEKVISWLKQNQSELKPVTKIPLRKDSLLVFDLSVGTHLLNPPGCTEDMEVLSRRLFREMEKAKAKAGIGRYNEARLSYTGPLFKDSENPLAEGRTVHLGMDVFLHPGSPVFAPLPGKVHSFKDNKNPLDYGPTLILEHNPEPGIAFYTLYGHLSRESIEKLEPGKKIKKGQPVGAVGNITENGGWPPHVHFQVITDLLGYKGDFPGVARFSQKNVWLSLCPDPNLILNIPQEKLRKNDLTPEQIIKLRKKNIGKSLSISYHKPLKIVRGYMEYLYDHTGQAFLDARNNVPHVGHTHPRVVEAVKRQVAVLNTNTRYLHHNLILYAQRLREKLPSPLEVCFFVNSGSEANDLALRLAWDYTGKKDIIVIDNAYHGHLSSLVNISPYKFNGPGGKGRPSLTHVVPMPDPYRGVYRYPEKKTGEKYAQHLRKALAETEKEGRGVAAFIFESLMGCGGQIVFPENYLKEAFKIVREKRGLCIADEVQVGFGRVGSHFWGFETQEVIPDILTLGKPMGNGFPLAAVVTTPQIADAFAPGMEYFNTYGGNPVSCAAGMAVLDVIEEEGLQQKAREVGGYLKGELERLKEKYPLIGDVRGKGLFLGLELVKDREKREPAPLQAEYLINRMREEGVLLSTDGPDQNVIKVKPPLVFTKDDADLLVSRLEKVLSEDPLGWYLDL